MQGGNDDTQKFGFNRGARLISALEKVGATNTGTWFKGHDIVDGSIEVLQDTPGGTFTSFTAKLMGSNAKDQPADATDGIQIGSDISAVGFVAVATKCRWYKIKTTAISVVAPATLGARFHAHTY